jgi:hypothetical protein
MGVEAAGLAPPPDANPGDAMPMPARLLAAAAAFALAAVPLRTEAQDAKPVTDRKGVVLTPEEAAERDARKDCKVAICAAFHNRKPGPDIACTVLKSWRKEQLDKLVSKAKVSWPWGRVRCSANVKLKRDMLVKALVTDKVEAQLDPHQVVCEVERANEAKAEIRFDFSPKITFEKGKAVKAALNWGKIDAPTLVKGAMWTATATDNTFNVLQSSLVEDINDFTSNGCDEVKADWEGK